MRISDWSSDGCSSDLQRISDSIRTVEERGRGGRKIDFLGLVATNYRLDNRLPAYNLERSEERRVGKVCVSTRRSRWLTSHYKQKTTVRNPNTQLNYTRHHNMIDRHNSRHLLI